MVTKIDRIRRLAIAGAVALVAAVGLASASQAGSLYDEQIHADSFGNLIILSPAGYKRIVVGRGYLAHRMRASRADGPKVVYLDSGTRTTAHCEHHAVLLHGRSYMYGLPDNVVPEPSLICR